MKIVATIEARMDSTRLPGKVLMPAMGKPMLQHLVRRLQATPSINEIVLATTTHHSDDPLTAFANDVGITVFRGSEEDVMERVIGAATIASADVIVEITGDCPVIDPDIVEQTIQMFLYHDAAYVSNVQIRSFPDGMDTQVFSLESLTRSASLTSKPLDREHVSLHMRNHPEIFPHVHLIAPPSLFWPKLGLTLDEKADYDLLKTIIETLGPENSVFSCIDIIRLLRSNPDLDSINKHVQRKGDS